MKRRSVSTFLLLSLLSALAACTTEAPLGAPVSIDAAIAAASRNPNTTAHTVAGYLVVDATGARLVDGLSLSTAPPTPLTPPADQIWLAALPASFETQMRDAGTFRYTAVAAYAPIEGPAAFGVAGAFRFQMRTPRIEVLSTQEATLANLLDRPDEYAGRLVRITGAVLLRDDAAVLVEQLGAGGVPAAGGREIKLVGAARDTALAERLQATPSGSVRFGLVQVEGLWRDGVLIAFSMLPVG